MNMSEAARIIGAMFPNAEWGDDNEGQLILYTGVTERGNGELVPFDPYN